MQPPAPKREPLTYDHYEVVRTLGTGAAGVVYLGRDLRIGREVALKTLQESKQRFGDDAAENEYFERFRREAELSGSLVHPNIITLYEVGYHGRRISYLAMEYVEGESLLSMLRRNDRLPVASACRIIDDILQGLAYAHGRGIIHRDIKPANILITLDGRAKIADFGVARSARSGAITHVGQLLGTPHYMAPEQVAGREIDGRSDLFSLGAVFYELLTGKKPFEGRAITDVLFAVVNQPTRSVSEFRGDIPGWCQRFVERLLCKVPDDRFESAAAAARELRAQLKQSDIVVDTPFFLDSPLEVQMGLATEETPTTPLYSSILEAAASDSPSRRAIKDRPVSKRVSMSVISIGIVAVLGTIVMLDRHLERMEKHEPPQVRGNPNEKRALLRDANVLYDAGAYEESLKRYDSYLAKYPWSDAATEGRTRTLSAMQLIAQEETKAQRVVELGRKKRRSERTRSTSVADSRSTSKPAEKPEPEKPSIWRRVRRIFGGE